MPTRGRKDHPSDLPQCTGIPPSHKQEDAAAMGAGMSSLEVTTMRATPADAPGGDLHLSFAVGSVLSAKVCVSGLPTPHTRDDVACALSKHERVLSFVDGREGWHFLLSMEDASGDGSFLEVMLAVPNAVLRGTSAPGGLACLHAPNEDAWEL